MSRDRLVVESFRKLERDPRQGALESQEPPLFPEVLAAVGPGQQGLSWPEPLGTAPRYASAVGRLQRAQQGQGR